MPTPDLDSTVCDSSLSYSLGCLTDTDDFRGGLFKLDKHSVILVPPTDTDALRADCSSVVRYRGRSREHGLRFTHEIATRRQVQFVFVVFVTWTVSGDMTPHQRMRPLPQLCSFLALRSWTITPAVVATSQGLTVTQLVDVWTLLSCVPDA